MAARSARTTMGNLNRRRFMEGSAAMIGGVGLSGLFSQAMAQETFPARPLSAIVAAAAGGGFDLMLRMVQPAWEKKLKQPFRPVYAPGAGGQIATQRLISQPADGYAFGVDAITNIVVTSHFSKPDNFTIDDLSFPGTIVVEPSVLLVQKGSRFADLQQFLDEARNGNSTIKVGVGGSRTFYHLISAIFKQEAKARNMSLIIYAGGGGASRTALIGGEVDAVITGLYAASNIYDRVRGLVVFDKTNPLPDVLPMPAQDSLDFKLPEAPHPNCVFVPASLQSRYPDRFALIEKTFAEAMADPETITAGKKLGFPEIALQNWGPKRLAAFKSELKDLLASYGNLL